MTAVLSPTEAVFITDNDDASLRLLDEGFRSLTAAYPDLRLEQTAEGEFVVMPPPYTETGRQNFRLDQQLGLWMAQGGGGEGFDSSSIFRLPNGAKRSPDLSWVEAARWAALAPELKREFAQICPDFVLELRSETDRLPPLQRKMREYIANGARLGWLIPCGYIPRSLLRLLPCGYIPRSLLRLLLREAAISAIVGHEYLHPQAA